MVASFLPLPIQQAFDDSGVPLSGGKLYTYEPGTFTPVNTWQDPDKNILNPNPIPLDGGGRLGMYGVGEVRMILIDKDGNTIYDHVGRVLQDTTAAVINAGALITAKSYTGQVANVVQGTHTVDPRTTKVRVRMWGGGGGGGAGNRGVNGEFYSGGGGGAGAFIELWRTNITPNSNFQFSFTFASGSGPQTPIGVTAIAGGATTLSDNVINTIIATASGGGGGGSSTSATGGAGGVGTFIPHPNIFGLACGGDSGGDGHNGFPINNLGVTVTGGHGGNSTLGGAGRAGVGVDGAQGGVDAVSYGSGGGGAYNSISTGGKGSPGAIWFEEYSETVGDAVPSGGTGGTGTGTGSETLTALTVTGDAHIIGTLNVDTGLAANSLAAAAFDATRAQIDTLTGTNATITSLSVQNQLAVVGSMSADAVNSNTATIGGLTVTGQLNYNGPAIGNALPKTGGTMTGEIVMPADPTASMEVATKHYVDIAVANVTPGGNTTAYLPVSGGTMSGNLFLNADPSTSVQAATKHYVDIAIANAIAPGGSTIPVTAVLTTGGTMTGALVLSGDPTTSLQAATKRYVDLNTVPIGGATMTGALVLSADPTTSLQAATKHYVDVTVANAGSGGGGVPVSALLTTGGTMTGFLLLNADPTNSLGAATKHYVDNAILAAGISGGGGSPNGALLLTGGTMVGNLFLNGDPTTSFQAATKHYVDTIFAGVTQGGVPSNVLLSTGGTMTGLLLLSADPQNPLGAVTKQYVDTRFLQFGGGTMTGPLVLAADPTASMQAATKHYVDTALAGINQGGTPATALLTTGGTMTGALLLATDPTATLQAATKHYVDVAIAGVQATLPGNALLTTGGTMTGTLLLNADPTANLAAATKQYVDTRISGTASLQITGGTMTGPLTLAGDPNTNLMAATKQYVDTKVSTITATGALPLTGGTMTGALVLNANPTIGLGAATKQYVDAQIGTIQGSGVTQAALDSVSTTATNAQNLANSAVAASQAADNTAATAASTANAAAVTANNVSAVANSAQSTANTALGLAQSSLQVNGGTITGGLFVTNEIAARMDSGFGQFRAVHGGKSVLIRNDGSDAFLLDGGDTTGGWTGNRPFQWNFNSGNVFINNSGGDTTVGGMLYANRALSIHYDGNYTANPVANDTVPTGTGLFVAGTTTRTGVNQREFALIAGLHSTMGRNGSDAQGADKVALYGGIEALNNASGDIWGLNTVSTVGDNMHDVYCYGYEVDVNFLPGSAEDRTNNFDASIMGVAVTGIAANGATKTAAFSVNEGNNAWARGLWFVNPGIRYHAIEDGSNSQNCFFVSPGSNHNTFLNAAGMDFNVAAQIMRKGTNNSIGWLNADGSGNLVRQYVTGNDMFLGAGGNGLFSAAAIAFAPATDNTQALGTGFNRWQTIWSVNGTVQTSDISQKTNIETLPNTLDLVMDIDPIKYNWSIGGKKRVTKKEKQLVQAKEKRTRTIQKHEMINGKMTVVKVDEEYDELLYDMVPLHDEHGKPLVEHLEADMHRPAIAHEKITHVPRMVEQEVEVDDYVEVPGKRTHWGFAAQHVKEAVDKHGMGDFGGHVVMEDGTEGLRPDQLIPVLWKAVQELTNEVRELKNGKPKKK